MYCNTDLSSDAYTFSNKTENTRLCGNIDIKYDVFQISTDGSIQLTSRGTAIYTEPNPNPYESELEPTKAEIHTYGTLGQDDSNRIGDRNECNPYETEPATRDKDEHHYKDLDLYLNH